MHEQNLVNKRQLNNHDEIKLVLSNSRLSVHFLDIVPGKVRNFCKVTLDRIAITGKFYAEMHSRELERNNWQESQPRVDGYAMQFQLYKFKGLKRVSIATLARNTKSKIANSWRLDTSNHLEAADKKKIINILALFGQKHITRMDIAFDWINFADVKPMKYRFIGSGMSSRSYYSKAGKLETLYAGGGNRIYRYYDKAREQRAKRQQVPYKSWERLEIQLRPPKTKTWIAEIERMLSCFKKSNQSKSANGVQGLALLQLIDHPEEIDMLGSRTTKAKYKKLLKNYQDYDETYPQTARKVFAKRVNELKAEINSFLDA